MTRKRRWILGFLLLAIDFAAAGLCWWGSAPLSPAGALGPVAYLAAVAWLGGWSFRGGTGLATRRALPLIALLDATACVLIAGSAPSWLTMGPSLLLIFLGRELVFAGARRISGPSVSPAESDRGFDRALEKARLGALRSAPRGEGLVLKPFYDESEDLRGPRLWRDAGGLVLAAPETPAEGTSRRCKRNLDVLMVVALIPLVLPLTLLIALWVRIVDGSPVFYRQERLTLHLGVFRILKIRSMRRDAESGAGPQWPIERDPRSTPTGFVLRRFWLDELPQLLQVLRGDLSIVGPRPERPEFAQVFLRDITIYRLRYTATAGITGLAQARGYVGNTSLRKRAFCDRLYIDRWSPCLDLWIIFATLGQMIRRTERRQYDFMPGRDSEIP